jgi:hypothetical protein
MISDSGMIKSGKETRMKSTNRRSFLKRIGLFALTGLAFPWLTNRRDTLGDSAPGSFEIIFPQPDLSYQGALAPEGIILPRSSLNTPLPAAPTAYQLQTPHQVLMMDLTNSEYVTRFNQLVSQGYRPIWSQGSTNGTGAATFSAVWVRDGAGPWYEWHNMTATDYQNNFNTYASQGYRPISVSGYQDGGNNYFGAV